MPTTQNPVQTDAPAAAATGSSTDLGGGLSVSHGGQVEVCVIVPNRRAQTIGVEDGTTVAELAELIGVHNPGSAQALNSMGQFVGADHRITSADDRLSFVTKLTGASR